MVSGSIHWDRRVQAGIFYIIDLVHIEMLILGNTGPLTTRSTLLAQPRATVPRNGGHQPKTGGHQPKDWQALPFNEKRLNDLTKLLEADVSEVVCGVLFWFGGLVFFAPLFYAPAVFFFSFVSASSFDWHGADYALSGGPHLGPGRDVCLRLSRCIPTVSRRTLGTQVMIGDPVVDAGETGCAKRVLDHPCCQGDFSSPCNQTRTERARGIAHHLASDFRGEGEVARAVLDQPCLQRDCVPRI